jgi:coenzyme F420 hydrogenase subunit beta
MADVRGMRMGFAPVLALLETAAQMGHTKIAVVGIPCQIYALRRLEEKLGLTALYVIGTPCSDNTTTKNFHYFLERLTDRPQEVTYLEFRADYHVELRFKDGQRLDIPFLKLPLSGLPNDFFPMTCKTCVDYTNALSDITVGYMGGQGDQWVIVRNKRGAAMLDALGDLVRLEAPGTGGKRASSVKGFMANTVRAAGGLPLRKMPNFMRGIMGWLMPKIGPKGLEFAKARLEMKAIETVLHLRSEYPAKMKNMIPNHVWSIVEPYDLKPGDGEKR